MSTPTSSRNAHRGPVERYGSRPQWPRRLAVAGTALLGALALGWLLWAALYHSDPDVSARLQGFTVTSSSAVEVTVAIERDPGTAVGCVLRAQAGDHSTVGERQVVVPAGAQRALVRTWVVTTERRATNGVLDGCRVLDSAVS